MNYKMESRLMGEISITSNMHDTTLMAKNGKNGKKKKPPKTKEPLDEGETPPLKLHHQNSTFKKLRS